MGKLRNDVSKPVINHSGNLAHNGQTNKTATNRQKPRELLLHIKARSTNMPVMLHPHMEQQKASDCEI